MNLGPTELIIILVIVLVLFGAGRLARIGNELGSGMREVRRELSAGKPPDEEGERK
jgi:sec-independent protein translocase protein TatA